MERLQRMFAGAGGGFGHPPLDSHTPDTFEQVCISSLALLKMLKHGRAGVPMEVMGLMLGILWMSIQFVLGMFLLCRRVVLVLVLKLLIMFSRQVCFLCLNKPEDQRWLLAGTIHILDLVAGYLELISTHNRVLKQ